jgi:predicted transcriptional regulator
LDQDSIAPKWKTGPAAIIAELREFQSSRPSLPVNAVSADSITCLECGWTGKTLRRHLKTAHGWSGQDYLRRWNLPKHQSLTASSFSDRSSVVAKTVGLGKLVAIF